MLHFYPPFFTWLQLIWLNATLRNIWKVNTTFLHSVAWLSSDGGKSYWGDKTVPIVAVIFGKHRATTVFYLHGGEEYRIRSSRVRQASRGNSSISFILVQAVLTLDGKGTVSALPVKCQLCSCSHSSSNLEKETKYSPCSCDGLLGGWVGIGQDSESNG